MIRYYNYNLYDNFSSQSCDALSNFLEAYIYKDANFLSTAIRPPSQSKSYLLLPSSHLSRPSSSPKLVPPCQNSTGQSVLTQTSGHIADSFRRSFQAFKTSVKKYSTRIRNSISRGGDEGGSHAEPTIRGVEDAAGGAATSPRGSETINHILESLNIPMYILVRRFWMPSNLFCTECDLVERLQGRPQLATAQESRLHKSK